MLTGSIRNQIDSIWNDFWAGGVANPLSVIEQITYLLFIKRLDELHTLEERKAQRLKIAMERRIFPEGKDERGSLACCKCCTSAMAENSLQRTPCAISW